MDQQGFLLKDIRMCPLWLHKLVLIARYRLLLFVSSKYNSEQARLDLNLVHILKAAVFTHKLVLLIIYCWISQFLSGLCSFHTLILSEGSNPAVFYSCTHSASRKNSSQPGSCQVAGVWLCKKRHTYFPCRPSSAPVIELNIKKPKKQTENDPLPPVHATYPAFVTWTILFRHCYLRPL